MTINHRTDIDIAIDMALKRKTPG